MAFSCTHFFNAPRKTNDQLRMLGKSDARIKQLAERAHKKMSVQQLDLCM